MLDRSPVQLTDQHWDDLVLFTQRLVQTPSLPGEEGQVAALVQAEMERLGYDEVRVDQAGNVVGTMRGAGDGSSLLLNTHMDHVAVGDPARWPHRPFGAEIHDDAIWGRATVDIKGPLAAQVYAVAALKQAGYRFPADVHVAAVVMEEVGGLGTIMLLEWLRADIALIGEPSNLRLARGHRGRVELHATVHGRAAHASVPHLAVNPHYSLARFLGQLASLPMVEEGEFGASSVAPTLYSTDNTSANVIPQEATVVLDYRNVPSDTPERVQARLNDALQSCLDPEARGEVVIAERPLKAYTGYEHVLPAIFPSFVTPADHPAVRAGQVALAQTLDEVGPVMIWRFATDGGHTAAVGIPTIGFGPGDDRLAHTVMEHLPLAQLRTGCAGTIALVDQLGHLRRDA
ncbi:MAG: M20/M25/M40 family metallo-hydrolase [Anaerolineae bacterium]|nr:M20/M25/M40 family metallo-hydrolase [Anaerolineae bacterium]